MNKKNQLIRKIQALDFAIYEMVLYLDTHPYCAQGLRLLAQYRAERKAAVTEYENTYGKLVLTVADAGNVNRWNWVNDPWPWENEGNE